MYIVQSRRTLPNVAFIHEVLVVKCTLFLLYFVYDVVASLTDCVRLCSVQCAQSKSFAALCISNPIIRPNRPRMELKISITRILTKLQNC
jgi:hypothetical protein